MQKFLSFDPAVIQIILFWSLKTLMLCEVFPQKIIA